MSDWLCTTLGDVATLQRGHDLPLEQRSPGTYSVVGSNGPVGTHDVSATKGPGVTVGRSGSVGKVVWVDEDFWPLNTTLWVKDFHGNDPRFVYHLLQWLNLSRYSEGAGVPTLNRNLLHPIEIEIPPTLDEQKRIAAVLDKADALRRQRQESLQLTEKLLQSVFIDMFGDPLLNPMDWPKRPLGEVCKRVVDCPHTTPRWTESGVICLRTSNLGKGHFIWDDTRYVSEAEHRERTRRLDLEPGDIVLSREGTVGIAAIVPENVSMSMGQRLVQLRLDPESSRPLFMLRLILWTLAPERIGRAMVGSTSKHLNVRELRDFRVICPPLSLQKTFEEVAKLLSEQKIASDDSEHQVRRLFSSLQQRAFRGELDLSKLAL